MKKTFNLQYSILLFLGYIAYLLLEGPLNLILGRFSLPPLYQGMLSNLMLLLPLLVLVIFLLLKLNLKNRLSSNNKKIFLIPVAYLLFTVAMNYSAFKSAVSFDFLVFIFGLSLVGFSEEFIFRGILFPKISAAFSSIYYGAIASSLLFGVVHYINLLSNLEFINEITYQVISSFSIGILMCGILYKTKNLYIPALIHTTFNLQATVRTFNSIRNEHIPLAKNREIFHPSLWDLLSQEIMFNSFCLVAGLLLIYQQNKKEQFKIATDEVYKT